MSKLCEGIFDCMKRKICTTEMLHRKCQFCGGVVIALSGRWHQMQLKKGHPLGFTMNPHSD